MSLLRAALRDEWDGIGRISRDIRIADLVTLTNALVGVGSIIAAARGHLELAGYLILAGIILDGMDGLAARLWGGGPLGGFLDTLADVITFAVAPAVLLVLALELHPAAMIVAGFYVSTVMFRLARFEALREKKHLAYFSGMSSPGGALALTVVLLAGATTFAVFWAAVSGFLMVSRIRYPKLRGWLGIVAVLLLVIALATAKVEAAYGTYALYGLIAFMSFYVLAGPFYVLAKFGAPYRKADEGAAPQES